MTSDIDRGHVTTGRHLPAFFRRWQENWGEPAADWTPTDYLNQESAIAPTIAAGWLFNPPTVEYRGAIFLADRFNKENADHWFEQHPGEPGRIEAVINELHLWDLFANAGMDAYQDALPGLAADVAACWSAVLAARYPDRTVTVDVSDAYGPTVTFWTHDQPGQVSI